MSEEKPVSDITLIIVVAILCGTFLAGLWIIFG